MTSHLDYILFISYYLLGYVGAYIDDGLYQKILLELAFELRNALPEIMQNHFLKYMWAYKYDSDYTGINTHADQAVSTYNNNMMHYLVMYISELFINHFSFLF